MRTGRPLLAAAALAVAANGAAYAFGPDAPAAKPPALKRGADSGKATSGTGSGNDAETAGNSGAGGSTAACTPDPEHPKRELRGVWIATVDNLDWPSRAGLPVARQQAEYTRILDEAVKRRFNAVFVQIRPASDALYKSALEPWSRYLTGKAGKDPGWDPLTFLTAEAHRRGLEFHAWLNPYRASFEGGADRLPPNHPARLHPGWTIPYEGRLYYDPGLPQVRDHVTAVVKDVVSRYDVDGVHFDDYFYPYPGAGGRFGDQASYRKYGKGQKLADWRRANVDKLIAQVDRTVHETKSYVKFGVSPFGIWRNKAQDRTGSATSGMSAYDSIYADARHWIRKGTVDYVIPQLYWPRGFQAADYDALAPWWANEVKGTGVHLYIGMALYQVGTGGAWRSPGELASQLGVNRKQDQIRGEVYFSAKQLLSNPLGALNRISKSYYDRPALLPLMKDLGGRAPARPAGLGIQGRALSWNSSAGARAYAVYRIPSGKVGECATADARHLVAVVPAGGGPRQAFTAPGGGAYLVTAVDRLGHESDPAQVTAP
ncbi:glycoside hydrolase family 10 protein [Streptosporangium sp. NPDC004379]|uniref:glycoside hydrolase family 10 protein n=1 Tax=Streptosporangium sp. NPDC004379 TaxID=3366189 RepID=UPI0036C80F7B